MAKLSFKQREQIHLLATKMCLRTAEYMACSAGRLETYPPFDEAYCQLKRYLELIDVEETTQ